MSDAISLVILAALAFCGLTILRLLAAARKSALDQARLRAEILRRRETEVRAQTAIPEVR